MFIKSKLIFNFYLQIFTFKDILLLETAEYPSKKENIISIVYQVSRAENFCVSVSTSKTSLPTYTEKFFRLPEEDFFLLPQADSSCD